MEKSNKLEELEGLIDLTEKVSDKIDWLHLQGRKSFINLSLVAGFAVVSCFSFIYLRQSNVFVEQFGSLSGVCFVILIIFFVFYLTRIILNQIDVRKEIEKESRILNDLFDMTYEYKALVYKELSPIKKATIDMRLSRINFSKASKTISNKPKATSIEVSQKSIVAE